MEDLENDIFQKALNYFLGQKKIWTQAWLAKEVGVSQQTISKIASGKSFGREKTRIKIANAFGKNYLEFLNFGETKKIDQPRHLRRIIGKIESLDKAGINLLENWLDYIINKNTHI